MNGHTTLIQVILRISFPYSSSIFCVNWENSSFSRESSTHKLCHLIQVTKHGRNATVSIIELVFLPLHTQGWSKSQPFGRP